MSQQTLIRSGLGRMIARRINAIGREVKWLKKRAEYLDYLQSPEWQWVRAERQYFIAKGKCERCARRTATDAHHRFYRKNIWDTKAEDIEMLCRECHKEADAERKARNGKN